MGVSARRDEPGPAGSYRFITDDLYGFALKYGINRDPALTQRAVAPFGEPDAYDERGFRRHRRVELQLQIVIATQTKYSIRTACADDLAVLPDIEKAAAGLFRQSNHPQMADAPIAAAKIDLNRDRVWVAVDARDAPVGFVIVHVDGDSTHIHEIDVHPTHARLGLGRKLIECAARWARERGMNSVTLTTFDDVPWNAPYYARLGFRLLDIDALPKSLRAVQQVEQANGFPMAHRVCMQLDLN